MAIKVMARLTPKDRRLGPGGGDAGQQGGAKAGSRGIARHFVQAAHGQAVPGQTGIDGGGT